MALFEVKTKKSVSNLLTDRFIIPPFTVFDTRMGYWQDRKRKWLSLGIQSELGRDDKLLYNIGHFNYDMEVAGLDETKSSRTSIFDPVLCEITYRWFSQAGDVVLDPFAGGSVRGIVAGSLKRYYTGIDLSENQINANKEQLENIIKEYDDMNNVRWICGDSLNVKTLFKDKADLIFTCPPYYDLEVYSDNEADLSNMETYEDFLDVYGKIIENCVDLLREDSFAVFVVGNARNSTDGGYYNIVGDTVKLFQNCGMLFYNDAIILNVAGTLPVRTPKQFDNSRKLGKQHQNYLVFYKGNPKNIKDKFGSFEI